MFARALFFSFSFLFFSFLFFSFLFFSFLFFSFLFFSSLFSSFLFFSFLFFFLFFLFFFLKCVWEDRKQVNGQGVKLSFLPFLILLLTSLTFLMAENIEDTNVPKPAILMPIGSSPTGKNRRLF